MSEAGKPLDGGNSALDGAGKPKSDFISKAESDRLLAEKEADRLDAHRRRDENAVRAQTAEAKLAEIERVANETKAAADGNIEALRTSFTERENTLKTETATAKTQLENAILKADVYSVLSEISTDSEVAFLLLKDDFEVKADEHGNLVARPKKDTASVKDYILKKLEAKPYLLKNNRAEGAATKKVDGNGRVLEATEIPADLFTRSKAEQTKWMTENPKLAAAAALKAMGGG